MNYETPLQAFQMPNHLTERFKDEPKQIRFIFECVAYKSAIFLILT
jgi:hypothetical protein